jgi:1-acyl-sn-glycerol-3-phosphate acyltransferase
MPGLIPDPTRPAMKSPVAAARLRLAALWVAVFGRALGEHAVRAYALMRVSNGWSEPTVGFLFLWLGLAAVPAFALAPLIGALASSRWRWPVMVLATFGGLVAIAWSSYDEYRTGLTLWVVCAGLLAFESAFFSAGRFAIMPEAARSARVSLPQLNGLFLLGTAAGMLLGAWVGVRQFNDGRPGLPVPLQYGHVGYGLALVAVLLARFAPARPVRVNDGLILPFLRTARAVFRTRNGRNSLIALWGLFAVALLVWHWLMPQTFEMRVRFLIALSAGVAVGALHWHPFRTLGRVPVAGTGLAVCALWWWLANDWSGLALPFFLGLPAAPLLTGYQINQPESSRGHGAALLHAGWAVIVGAFLFYLLQNVANPAATKEPVAAFVAGLCVIGGVFAWLTFLRPTIEWLSEVVLNPFYRVLPSGPGYAALPWQGPALVIANHSAWFDPMWLAKVIPAPETPMMISKFYDLPVISWLMRYVVGTIRVQDAARRKDAPEIKDAIAALDRGEIVVIFPEGWLRRKEEHELRRFARGVWQILAARPDIPVFACWIDGNWGSYVSYKDGPPTKNKKLDVLRPIRISFLEPFRIDPALLTRHMETRLALMRKVLEARALLGLPPIDPFKLTARDEEEGGGGETPTAPRE